MSLDKLSNTEFTKIPTSLIKPIFINGRTNLNIFASNFSIENNEAKLKQYFINNGKLFNSLRIFGGDFTNIFNAYYGNFKFLINKNLQVFGVKSIDIKIPDGSSWILLKNHSNSFSIQIPIQLEIGFYGVTKTYTGLMFASVLMSNFGY